MKAPLAIFPLAPLAAVVEAGPRKAIDPKQPLNKVNINIKQRFFMDDFIGESLLDIQGNFKGVTVSKTNLDPKNEDKYDNEVDAIAGSTITGDGVTAMIRSDLSLYQPYFNSLNN